MGAPAESRPDVIVCAVGSEPLVSGCHKPSTGRAVGIRGAGGALGTLRSSKIDFLFISCGIIALFVVVVTAFPTGEDTADSGGKSKEFNAKIGLGIENCSLIALFLAFWASI